MLDSFLVSVYLQAALVTKRTTRARPFPIIWGLFRVVNHSHSPHDRLPASAIAMLLGDNYQGEPIFGFSSHTQLFQFRRTAETVWHVVKDALQIGQMFSFQVRNVAAVIAWDVFKHWPLHDLFSDRVLGFFA